MIDLGDFTDEKALSEADAVRFYRETANLTNGNHEHHEESSSFDRFFLIFRIGRCTKISA